MIPFASRTVTLYNRRAALGEDGRTLTVWQRRVLAGCSWICAHESVREGTVLRRTRSVVCRIPASKDYVAPDVWDGLEDTAGRFTLAPGDILVCGEASEEIGRDIDSAQLLKKYARRGAIMVQSAKDNAQNGVLEHYVARASLGNSVQRGHRP